MSMAMRTTRIVRMLSELRGLEGFASASSPSPSPFTIASSSSSSSFSRNFSSCDRPSPRFLDPVYLRQDGWTLGARSLAVEARYEIIRGVHTAGAGAGAGPGVRGSSTDEAVRRETGVVNETATEGSEQEAAAAAGAKSEEEPCHADAKNAHEEEIVDEKTQVLRAAMAHVRRLGWMEAALVAGARDVGLSPSIVGSFERKDAALVEFFMDECNHRLQEQLEGKEKDLPNMLLADRIASIVRMRLEMNIPVITKWASALSIQANPVNAPTALKQRALLVDDIWHAAGDRSSDVDWYTKRALLGAVYMTTELYMLTDFTPGYRDTWTFLEGRIKDAVNARKTGQEAIHLAQAVGQGLSNSFASFFKNQSASSKS